jgi:choline dehydrogenase-like flavoprotein
VGTRLKQFDAIVVGSGFGGSVAAYRLAEAARCVFVLDAASRLHRFLATQADRK